MLFTSKTIIFLAAAANLIRAAPTASANEVVGVDFFNSTVGILDNNADTEGWASFCDNADCNNCGMSVSLTNPGCLRQTGRKAVKFHGNPIWNTFTLIASPDDQCGCQSSCQPGLHADSGCFPLDDLQGGSYRFITGDGICPSNNC